MSGFEKYHLGEKLEYKSGGLMASFKLILEEIEERQKRVVGILKKYSGLKITEREKGLYFKNKENSKKHNFKRIEKLLIENSILIDAKKYSEQWLSEDWRSLNDIKDTLETFFTRNISLNIKEDYNIVESFFGEILLDLYISIGNGTFKPSDEELVEIQNISRLREKYLIDFRSYVTS